MDEFATAFADADSLQVLDIYPASEQPIEGITGEALARKIAEKGNTSAKYAGSFEDAVTAAMANAADGDIVLTLGAGSVSQLGAMVLDKLRSPAVVEASHGN
jgi:UDP-N-acetylmuramate--alanine ligase